MFDYTIHSKYINFLYVSDIDECDLGTDSCDPSTANCVNLDPGYDCQGVFIFTNFITNIPCLSSNYW